MNAHTLALLALALGAAAAPAHATETPRHPAALTLDELSFALPEPQTFTLENGVRVYLFENHQLPLVALTAQMPMETRFLPLAERMAFRTLGLLWREGGAGPLSPAAVDERVAALGMELAAGAGDGRAQVNALMMKADLDAGAPLWRDLCLHPAFDPARLERAREQLIKDWQGVNDNPDWLAERWFDRLLAGEDTPGWHVVSRADIEAVSREAVERLYRGFLRPEALVIGIAGDIDLAEARRRLQALFGDWQPAAASGEAALPPALVWERNPQPGVYLLPGDFSQCHVRFGRPIDELTDRDPDYPLARLLDYGVGYNRVYLRTRREGLSYGTATRLTADADWGQFFAFGSSAPEDLLDLLRAIREEVAAIGEGRPLTAEEVAGSRTFLLGRELLSLETLSGVVNRRIGDLVTGRGEDFMPRMIAGLQAADAASLAAAAQRWVDFGADPVLLVVGAPEGGAEALAALGLGPVTVLEPVRFGD